MRQYLGFGDGRDGIKSVSGTEDLNTRIGVTGSNSSGQKVLNVDSVTGFSAGDYILIHKTRGNTTTNAGTWELNIIQSVGTGLFNLLYNLENTYNDSSADQVQVVKIPQYSKLTIPSSQSIQPSAWDGGKGGIVALMAKEIIVTGTINAAGLGFRGGLGNNNSNNVAETGEGTVGGVVNGQTGANGNAGGGGKVASPNPSGGSNGTQGTGSNPGTTSGNAQLENMTFGGGGGGKGMDNPTQNNGTPGGGIVVLYFGKLTVTGSVDANGTNAQTNAAAGGGGSIFLKGIEASIGTNLVTATGGTGGNNQGGNGRIRVEVCKLTGTTNPTISKVEGCHNFCASGNINM